MPGVGTLKDDIEVVGGAAALSVRAAQACSSSISASAEGCFDFEVIRAS